MYWISHNATCLTQPYISSKPIRISLIIDLSYISFDQFFVIVAVVCKIIIQYSTHFF